LNKKECLIKIKSFAQELLVKGTVCDLCYHNIEHTQRVVENAVYIAKMADLNADEMFIIKAVAWFHDLGYTECYDGHEDASISIASKFLKDLNVDAEIIASIVNGINATRVPQRPKDKLEEIIADADLFDLGTDDYFMMSEKLFKEWDLCIKPSSKEKQWYHSLNFLKEHSYFTVYGKDILESKKQENIAILEDRLANNFY
jgi:predicted metal-dependent HD superfamily phosphohydrolase